MGERDFHPISAHFLLPKWVKTHWPNYAEGKAKAGVDADPSDWRVARTIFVADDDKVASDYARYDSKSPYVFFYNHLGAKLRAAGRLSVFKRDPDQPDDEVSLEDACDDLIIHGSVNKVVDEILAFREEVGDFGELIYGGLDWVDSNLARRSMVLMAEEVMPRVNDAIGASRAA